MSRTVADQIHPLLELLRQDQRYHLEAYQFVREALDYAQETMQCGGCGHDEDDAACQATDVEMDEELQSDIDDSTSQDDRHITGQQLCEAIRLYSLEQFGFMAKTVLNSWGIYSTGDFGEIVYNLISIQHMRKSPSDRREDFDDLYEFSTAFDPVFELAKNED